MQKTFTDRTLPEMQEFIKSCVCENAFDRCAFLDDESSLFIALLEIDYELNVEEYAKVIEEDHVTDDPNQIMFPSRNTPSPHAPTVLQDSHNNLPQFVNN